MTMTINRPHKSNLTDAERRVLWKVAHRTKMDCWFALLIAEDGDSYVYDLEQGCTVPVHLALADLWEGIEDPENYANCNLTKEEDEVLRNCLMRFCGIEVPLGHGGIV